MKKNTTKKPTAPQMISLVSGSSGLGASWQSSIAPPSSRMWMHSSEAWSISTSPSPSCAPAGLANASTRPTLTAARASSNLLRRIDRSFCRPALSDSALAEEEDDEADEGESLDERDAEEHRGADHAGRLRLAGHGLDRLTDQVADAHAGADGAEAVGQGGETGVVDTAGGLLGQDGQVGKHCRFPSPDVTVSGTW